ncbi:hypothetical protein Tco_1054078 [Tanacetum coccineum]|uniref:Uncharacterized protein n=1 Tax=Tanacetum coccineum TaxID=301880 RepID=A0ABQ5GX02_9ASTR
MRPTAPSIPLKLKVFAMVAACASRAWTRTIINYVSLMQPETAGAQMLTGVDLIILKQNHKSKKIQQAVRDQALVPTDDRVKIDSSNMRIDLTMTQKEATYQVILDIIKSSSCYNAFLITSDVPEIYMQQFWFTVKKIKKSSFYQFQLDDKKFEVDVELFEKILHICPRASDKEFIVPSSHDSLVTFLKELGYKGPLEVISDLYVDYMHQPWRTLATTANKCLSGKTSDFQYQIDYRQSKIKRREIMPYPRFTKVIIQYFLSQHDFIFKRHGSYINIIKDDGVLGRLKFISKGELTQVYGLPIPDTMVNDEIKNSESYQTYLALSTGTKPLKKGRGKGGKGKRATVTLTKKGSLSAKENILSDPNEATELAISMRVDKEAVERQKKKKMKGIATDVAAQELLNLKGNILSIDDEETESEKETAKSEKADDKMADEEEGNSDDEVHTEEDEQTDDEAHDDEYVNNDVEKHDDADEEMNNVENDDEVKEDQEMVDAKKVESKKTEEEKNEKTELPPYTSSLSLSSDYGNQFFNLSSDVSLVGTVKETTDTEISSLLDVQIQQEIPHVLSAPLLDVLVSVIPKQTTPTPLTTPLPTPPTSNEAPNITTTVPDPLPALLQRLSDLERKFEAWIKVDHSESIEESVQANIINEVKNQLPKFLPKVVSNFVNPRIEIIVRDVLQKNPAFLAQSYHHSAFTPF